MVEENCYFGGYKLVAMCVESLMASSECCFGVMLGERLELIDESYSGRQ